jgi:hypothetical protein
VAGFTHKDDQNHLNGLNNLPSPNGSSSHARRGEGAATSRDVKSNMEQLLHEIDVILCAYYNDIHG